MKISPPTFWKRPVNGGPLEKAIPKRGEWTITGKYNGWFTWIHTPTRKMFNRHNEPLSIQSEFEQALDVACRLPFEWLCCEGLERRHKIGQGTLIILDTPIKGSFESRRNLIRSTALSIPGVVDHVDLASPMKSNSVYLPATNHGFVEDFWHNLKQANNGLGCEFWEGIVCDKNSSPFPMQLRNSEIEFAFCIKHRWKF